jgi:hypothetical protein
MFAHARTCTFLFCYAREKCIFSQQRSQVTQCLSGSKHIAAIVGFKDRPCSQSLTGEISATSSSSGPPQTCIIYDRSVKGICVHRHIPLFKINNPEFKTFHLKYTQAGAPDEIALNENNLPKCYEETNFMKLSPPSEAISCPATEDFPNIL